MSNIINRAEALIQSYYDQKEKTLPKLNALKAKIREIEHSVKVDGDEHHEILSQLKKRNNPDRVDGNGMRVGRNGTAPYIRAIDQLQSIPTNPRKLKQKETHHGNSSRIPIAIQEIIDDALFNDDRVKDVIRIVKTKLLDKSMELTEAKIILQLFLYEPPNSESRNIGESRLNATQYTK